MPPVNQRARRDRKMTSDALERRVLFLDRFAVPTDAGDLPGVVATGAGVAVRGLRAACRDLQIRRLRVGLAAAAAADFPRNRALDRPMAAVAQLHAQPAVLDE